MNSYKKWVGIWATLLLAGCQIPAAMIATSVGAMPVYQPLPKKNYDAPPQVIYTIDKNRFFTSENYQECSYGDVYYNDTSRNIKTAIDPLATFPGRFHIDGNQDVLVFPDSPSDGAGTCGNDRGCFFRIYYSLDGGRKFDWFDPWRLSTDRKDSYEMGKNITATLQGKHLYIADQRNAYVYTLEKGIMGGGKHIEGGPKNVPHVRTPSGQDHLTCDDSIHPKEIKK
jgi:hypothetical protein